MLTSRLAPGDTVTDGLFIALVALLIFAYILVKGSKEVRLLVAFLILYGLLRVFEVAFLGNGFNNWIRDMFQRISVAFSNLDNPDGLAFVTLGATIVVIGLLIWLIGWGPKNLRVIAGFLIILIVVRIFDAVALNNGFGDFAADVVRGLSNVFGQGAASIPAS